MSDALVHREDDDRIAVVTLDSPANRNALSRRFVAELTDHLTEAGADESLHGILLRSSHPVFCAGADLKEAARVDMVESARGIIALQRAIVAAPVPVLTRLDGPVRAGGLGLVASSDIVVCADSVTVALLGQRIDRQVRLPGSGVQQTLAVEQEDRHRVRDPLGRLGCVELHDVAQDAVEPRPSSCPRIPDFVRLACGFGRESDVLTHRSRTKSRSTGGWSARSRG